MLLSVTLVQADMIINIKPGGKAGNGTQEPSLHTLFNRYFGTSFEDGAQLFEKHGVKNPYTTWHTAGTEIVGGYGDSSASHLLSLHYASDGSVVGGNSAIKSISGTGADFAALTNSVVFGNIPDDIDLNIRLRTNWGEYHQNVWSNPLVENSSKVNMLAFDITALYNDQKNDGEDFASVYMFAWEDLVESHLYFDEDYQDLILIMTNLYPTNPGNSVPEPATLAVLGLGLAGVGLASRRRRK